MPTIYLDNNATTPILPEVAEAMAECYHHRHANPASQHGPGRAARRRLEAAREAIGRILGARLDSAHADQVIFTSGGTESNNLALLGLTRTNGPSRPESHLIISPIEHPSLVGAAEQLAREGGRIEQLMIDANGVVRTEQFVSRLTAETRLVSVMLGNNETGVLEPVAELAQICRRAGVPIHTDAVQVVGKLPVDFRRLGVDALSASAHKFHGPHGIGVLLVRYGVQLEPILHGGFQQAGLRPGTESVALAVGMQVALEIWQAEQAERRDRLTELRDRLEAQLLAGFPSAVVHAAGADRLPHTTAIAFPGMDRQALVVALDLAGVACSTGSACASGSSKPSPVLLAMGCEEALVSGSIRLSLGCLSSPAEVDLATQRILRTVNDLQHVKQTRKMAPTPPSPLADRL